jgi:hypothetical protein
VKSGVYSAMMASHGDIALYLTTVVCDQTLIQLNPRRQAQRNSPGHRLFRCGSIFNPGSTVSRRREADDRMGVRVFD